MIYEVRSERPYLYHAPGVDEEMSEDRPTQIVVETRRTEEKLAREDVKMLAMFGIKAWVVPINA